MLSCQFCAKLCCTCKFAVVIPHENLCTFIHASQEQGHSAPICNFWVVGNRVGDLRCTYLCGFGAVDGLWSP